MAVCVSKCASDEANGTGVKSGDSWMPDGVSLIHLIHQEQSLMVTLFGKQIFPLHGLLTVAGSLCFDPTFAEQRHMATSVERVTVSNASV